MVPNLGFFVFMRNFIIRQILSDFKYDNIVFKFQPESIFACIFAHKYPNIQYPNKAFLVPNLGFFVFMRNFTIRQILADFKYDNIVFKFQPESIFASRHFCSQI